MKLESDSIIIVRTLQGINSNSSISELMEFTRTAFQKSDFEMVKRILEDRENEKNKFEADNCNLIRQKLEFEEEIESLKKTVEEKDEAIVKLERDISELQQQLESRVLCLEKDVEIMKEQLQVSDEEIKQIDEADLESSKEASGNQSPTRNITQPLHDIILINDSDDEETNPVKNASVHGNDDVSLPTGKLPDDDEVTEISPILDSSVRKRKRVVCRDDDDDVSIPDSSKRKGSPPCDDDDVNVPAGELVADMASAGPVIRSCDEILNGGKVDLSVVNSDSSDISDDDEDLTDACLDNLAADPSPNSVISNSEKTNNSNRVWAHDMEMKKALENEDELCLNAVCALFWETESDVKRFDAERVTELVKILIDGDPNRKITKSSSELKKTRPSIVDECRKLADFYSKNLFQIYKNKKNPFFPCPKFQAC